MRGIAGATKPRLRVGFVLAEHFTLSAFSLFVDHLRLAADKDDRSRPVHCTWQIVASGVQAIRSSCGVSVMRDAPLGEPRAFDYIVVVGGLLHGHQQVDAATLQWLQRAAAEGIPLIGVCTGTFILCRAGLMKHRPVCVSWYHRQDFIEAFPDHDVVSDRMFLDDGDRITCSGGSGAADVALHLIDRSLGRSAGMKASHILLMERYLRPEKQARLQPRPPTVSDATMTVANQHVQRAILHMEQNMDRPLSVAQLASQLGISSRQLERLFHNNLGRKPQDFYRMLRLRYARALLESGQANVTNVAIESGFSDCSHFSRHFKLVYGISPSKCYRDAIQKQSSQEDFISPVGVRVFS